MFAWIASLRLMLMTMLVCVVGYVSIVFGLAQILVPQKAEGSLLRNAAGTIVGSSLIAQGFTSPRYFWPRPSAVDYDASAAGGSNKSPTSHDLTERAEKLVAAYGATPANPLPPELAAASGGGLDPQISEPAALYQAPRVAAARGLELSAVEDLVRRRAVAPGAPLVDDRLVDVLELNLALDALDPSGAEKL